MSELLASIQATDRGILKLLRQAALAKQDEYEKVLLTIMDGELTVISSGVGGTISYSTFTEGHSFHTIEVGEGVRERTPENEVPLTEALLNVELFLNYYELIRDSAGSVRLEFYGEANDRLATRVEMYGELNAKIKLPKSERDLEKMALDAPNRFDENNVWDGRVRLDTHIQTDDEKIQRIIDAVDADDITSIDNYPIVVEDGQFKIDATDGNKSHWIRGVLDEDESNVSGPDVANLYGSNFERVFAVLGGELQLQTTQDDGGAPLVVVSEDADGVIRHVIAPCGSL